MQVCGEYPPRTRSVKFLHHCACHSSAVPCFRSAAKLVDKYSGFSGYDVQHLSNFRHLNCVRAQPLSGGVCGRHSDDEGVKERYARALHRTV